MEGLQIHFPPSLIMFQTMVAFFICFSLGRGRIHRFFNDCSLLTPSTRVFLPTALCLKTSLTYGHGIGGDGVVENYSSWFGIIDDLHHNHNCPTSILEGLKKYVKKTNHATGCVDIPCSSKSGFVGKKPVVVVLTGGGPLDASFAQLDLYGLVTLEKLVAEGLQKSYLEITIQGLDLTKATICSGDA